MEEEQGEVALHVGETMAPALISVHPQGTAVVVAIGAGLRIFDFKRDSPVTVGDGTIPGRHGEAIRAVAFNKEGNLFASAGDDKLVKLWDTETWTCLKTTRLAKKVTGTCFSQDSKWLLFADKFGVVYVLSTASTLGKITEPVQLLAHCCSIITDLKVSADGKYIITSDRDFKIRVSLFPAVPTDGAHEIWSFCLGHTSFVTCVAFVGERSSNPQQLLVSGSGDATVRLWDYKTGELLDTFDTVDVGEVRKDESLEENHSSTRAVIGVSVSPDCSVVAVIIERYAGVLLLRYDSPLKKLEYLDSVALAEQVSPTSVVFDVDGRLWVVAGAAESVESSDRSVTPEEAAAAEAKAHAVAQTAVAQVRLIRFSSPSTETEPTSNPTSEATDEAIGSYVLCEDDSVPGGQALLRALQGNSQVENSTEEVAVAAEAAELAMRKLMTKRQYTIGQREDRKRMRNDKKLENKRVLDLSSTE